jgi:hypothetical protein
MRMHVYSCMQLEHNTVNIDQRKRCFEQRLQSKMKLILYVLYIFSTSIIFSRLLNKSEKMYQNYYVVYAIPNLFIIFVILIYMCLYVTSVQFLFCCAHCFQIDFNSWYLSEYGRWLGLSFRHVCETFLIVIGYKHGRHWQRVLHFAIILPSSHELS